MTNFTQIQVNKVKSDILGDINTKETHFLVEAIFNLNLWSLQFGDFNGVQSLTTAAEKGGEKCSHQILKCKNEIEVRVFKSHFISTENDYVIHVVFTLLMTNYS